MTHIHLSTIWLQVRRFIKSSTLVRLKTRFLKTTKPRKNLSIFPGNTLSDALRHLNFFSGWRRQILDSRDLAGRPNSTVTTVTYVFPVPVLTRYHWGIMSIPVPLPWILTRNSIAGSYFIIFEPWCVWIFFLSASKFNIWGRSFYWNRSVCVYSDSVFFDVISFEQLCTGILGDNRFSFSLEFDMLRNPNLSGIRLWFFAISQVDFLCVRMCREYQSSTVKEFDLLRVSIFQEQHWIYFSSLEIIILDHICHMDVLRTPSFNLFGLWFVENIQCVCHLILIFWDQLRCAYWYLDWCIQVDNFLFASVCFPFDFRTLAQGALCRERAGRAVVVSAGAQSAPAAPFLTYCAHASTQARCPTCRHARWRGG